MPMMNEKKFLEQYKYALESDFTSPTGEPATWAPGHPKQWGQEKATIQLNGKATTPTISPDDKLVAVGVGSEVHIFDIATQQRLEVLRGHTGEVGSVQFAPFVKQYSPNAPHYLLVSDSDDEPQMVILWELDKDANPLNPRENAPPNPDSLAAKILQPLLSELTTDHGWDPTEGALRTLDQEVRSALQKAIDTHSREHRLCFYGQLAHCGEPRAFSPDGLTMIYLSNNESTQDGDEPRDPALLPCVNLWDVASRSVRHQLHGHTDSIMWAAITPDSKVAASIAWDGTARIWDTHTGTCLHILAPPVSGQLWSGAFSPDGKYLAFSQGNPKVTVYVYNITNGQPVSYFEGFQGWIRSLDWSPDRSIVACAGDRGRVSIWDPYKGEKKMQWGLAFEDAMMSRFANVHGVRFVDGGRKLMFRNREGTVEVYDFVANLKRQFTRRAEDKIERSPHAGMVYSDASKLLIVPDMDGFLRGWDLSST